LTINKKISPFSSESSKTRQSRNHGLSFSPHCNALVHAVCVLVDCRASSPKKWHILRSTFKCCIQHVHPCVDRLWADEALHVEHRPNPPMTVRFARECPIRLFKHYNYHRKFLDVYSQNQPGISRPEGSFPKFLSDSGRYRHSKTPIVPLSSVSLRMRKWGKTPDNR
jgi:hypothetical protein